MSLAVIIAFSDATIAAEGAGFDEEVITVKASPGGGEMAADSLPFSVQSLDADALERAQSTDLADYLATHLGSVSINSAQGNPLQPDVLYRGYSASPVLGLAQGISVYQNGVRVNEPLGDAVNWELIPESAIHTTQLIGGSNPMYGLNTLGGALSIEMKNGFNFEQTAMEIQGGSWDRVQVSAESGANNGHSGYYLNVNYFDENGWRDLSTSNALNLFGVASYRGDRASLDLDLQYGNSDLTGNGTAPRGLVEIDRSAIFTAPDITENEMFMAAVNGTHALNERIELAINVFYRKNDTASFNGDASDFAICNLHEGAFLLERLDDDRLEAIDLVHDDICATNALGVAHPVELEDFLNSFIANGEPFNIDDLTPNLSGTGVLADGAMNNRSSRRQASYGGDLHVGLDNPLLSRANMLTLGASYFNGAADFQSVTELSNIDPVTRSTAGLGVGSFLDSEATDVATSSATLSFYLLDVFHLTERLILTIGGRYNETWIDLDDSSGLRPELDGRHHFARFNPTFGATFDIASDHNVYASYSESARAPTPIELACNDTIFERAREAAVARGEDADDVNFECRLPNAFLADPPLAEVVAKSIEAGVRGRFGETRHRLGYFRTDNHDDIIFQSTGRGTGLFANVGKTRREGFESAFGGTQGRLDWSASYSFVHATFEEAFAVLAPNHPLANVDDEVQVSSGDRIPGVADHQFKFSADYQLPWNVRLGGELLYNAGQFLRGDESNDLAELDGYTVVNARASYRYNEHFELFARVTNVFDSIYANFGLLGEDPGRVLPELADRERIFVGAGAPRAAWVGLRLRM